LPNVRILAVKPPITASPNYHNHTKASQFLVKTKGVVFLFVIQRRDTELSVQIIITFYKLTFSMAAIVYACVKIFYYLLMKRKVVGCM